MPEAEGRPPKPRRQALTGELLSLRDDLCWDLRNGIRTREGLPPMRTAEIAALFGLAREHIHERLRLTARRRARELKAALELQG